MGELTPRERVHLALSHEQTDRVPVDFLATPETWARLRQHLHLPDNEAVLQRLGIDLRHPRQPYVGPPLEHHPDGSWTDEWGVRRRRVKHEGGAYDEIAGHPLAGVESIAAVDKHPWPKAEWWDVDALEAEVQSLDEQGCWAIALEEFGDPGGIFEISWYLRGMEQFLVDMIEKPELAFAIMDRVTRVLLARLERVMSRLGSRIDLIWTSDDVAHQSGPILSVPLWRELIAPHHERFNRRAHELGSKVMYHSCGAIRPFIPELMAIGVDVLDVLQFSAKGMEPGEIKDTFGDKLCLHGGIDVQRLLPFANEEEVRRATRQLVSILGRKGGYILSPTHNIQVDTPPISIVAVYAEAGSLASL